MAHAHAPVKADVDHVSIVYLLRGSLRIVRNHGLSIKSFTLSHGRDSDTVRGSFKGDEPWVVDSHYEGHRLYQQLP